MRVRPPVSGDDSRVGFMPWLGGQLFILLRYPLSLSLFPFT
jgi:hypothetical protein